MAHKEMRNWIPCPVCGQKTKTQACQKTVMINFPLYCPRCKQVTTINVLQFRISMSKEPDA